MAEKFILAEEFTSYRTNFQMRTSETLPEKDLIGLVRKGRKEAYQVIVTRYMGKAYYIALGFVHNQQDALDISQEAFIKAYRKIKTFDADRPFYPWFYEIIKNLCLDHLKRRKQKKEVPLNGVRILKDEKEDRELKATIWKGIDALPFEQKEIILLRYFQQLSYQEIADITGKPLGTVMSSLYYARLKLRHILADFTGLSGGRKRGISDGA